MLNAVTNHCVDVSKDRQTGAYWERQFSIMAGDYGKSFSFMQMGRTESIQAFAKRNNSWNRYTAPDIVIWTSPGEHHEIKHKNPTRDGLFGLEKYRFDALLWFALETGQPVMYTIHNHDLAGGKFIELNNIAHWQTANVLKLNNRWTKEVLTFSWVNGQKRKVPTYYWSSDLWMPLKTFWSLI